MKKATVNTKRSSGKSGTRSIGYLEVIAGPMYCGKTEELIRLVKRAMIGKRNVQVFKHKIDVRYGNDQKLYSHSGGKIDCEVIEQTPDILSRIHPETDTVAIDEAQWLGEELVPVVSELLSRNLHVIVTGLALTFDRQPFVPIPTLMAMADRVLKLSSVCVLCGRDAVFHKRISDGKHADALTNDPSLVQKHSGSAYEARCRNCFSRKP